MGFARVWSINRQFFRFHPYSVVSIVCFLALLSSLIHFWRSGEEALGEARGTGRQESNDADPADMYPRLFWATVTHFRNFGASWPPAFDGFSLAFRK